MEPLSGIIRRLTGLGVEDSAPKSLGLSHSLFRPTEKVDTKFIEDVGLLDDLDKELNKLANRVRKSYGHHFPELANILSDDILYAKVVKLMGHRTNATMFDFSEVLPTEIETHLKAAADVSKGSELKERHLNNINGLCDQVLSLSEARARLCDDLKIKMNTIAPNLTALVGELVGARLIAKGGGLLNLAKEPGSRIQILGPKHRFIYKAPLISKTSSRKNKRRMARSLGAKIALAIRCDALGDTRDNSMGLGVRAQMEARSRSLEARSTKTERKKKSKRKEVGKEEKAEKSRQDAVSQNDIDSEVSSSVLSILSIC